MMKSLQKKLLYSSCSVFLLLASFSIFSSNEVSDQQLKIKDFYECLTSNPKEIDHKLCNAYVAWSANKEELISCLKHGVVVHKESDKDQEDKVFEVNVRMKCESARVVSIRFRKSEETEKFLITWVGEIVN